MHFFRGMFETALEPGELITAVKFPLPVAAGYAKLQNAASRFALVGVFVAKFASGVRVAVTGAGPVVFRVPAFEAALSRRFEPDCRQRPRRRSGGIEFGHSCRGGVSGAPGLRHGQARCCAEPLPDGESEEPMNSRSQTAATHTAPQSLARLSATQILDGYRAGDFTPRDVIDEVIVALKSTDALCKVMTTDMFASARSEADRAGATWKAGEAKALTGVPITVKDLIYVAGTRAQAGAPMLDGFVPEVDAAVVTAVKDAGAIITCKTTTCESGYKLTADSPVSGVTRNPWHLGRTSGGSSGGAAAAIAAGCGPLAIATDGVGSIRVPCSFCGVFGLKPTYGLVPAVTRLFPAVVAFARSYRSHRAHGRRCCTTARRHRRL